MATPSEWQPNAEGLQTLMQILASTQTTDNVVHREATEKLNLMSTVPEFPCYLAYAFEKGGDVSMRAVAGLVLRHTVRRFNRFPETVQLYIRRPVLVCLRDETSLIRQSAASVITTIIGEVGFEIWPELLPMLSAWLDDQNPTAVDGALFCIQLLAEDNGEKMLSDMLPEPRPLNLLVPRLVNFFGAPSAKWRRWALSALTSLIDHEAEALYVNMDGFLQGVFMLATDSDAAVRRGVCEAFSQLLLRRSDVLADNMGSILEYMLICLADTDAEEVQKEAAEFISTLCQTQQRDYAGEVLVVHLPRLLPLLLDGMQYDDMELAMMKPEEEEDESIPDKPEEIKPFIHASRGDAVDEDEEDTDFETPTEFNLRKCSAACLDLVAHVFHAQLLDHILPLVAERLNSPEWLVRETAVLALGAIAGGCERALAPQLPDLMTFFFRQLSDPNTAYLVRSITCWTVSRYTGWVLMSAEENPAVLREVISQLLTRVSQDRNKKVQHAACSAFAEFEEEAQNELDPYIDVILQHLTHALGKYQKRNLFSIYDAIGTLAESVGESLAAEEAKAILLPALVAKWNSTSDSDITLPPLLACLACVTTALGENFLAMAAPVWGRCLKLIEMSLVAATLPKAQRVGTPDKKVLQVALDQLSAMVDSFGDKIPHFVTESNLFDLLGVAVRDKSDNVRQSALALVGDMVVRIPKVVEPVLPSFVPVCVSNMLPDWVPVCNNAMWVLGEAAVAFPPAVLPVLPAALDKLVHILRDIDRLYVSLIENAGITVGRLALVAAAPVSERVPEFLGEWCVALTRIRSKRERESAYSGLCAVCRAAPRAVLAGFGDVLQAFMQCRYPSHSLQNNMAEIVREFKRAVGDETWNAMFSGFTEWFQREVARHFGV